MGKDFLIWLDILGFQELAHEVAEQSSLSERKVRDDFIRIINEKVTDLEKNRIIVGKKYGEGEDWLLVTPSLDFVFKAVTCLLDHNTGYKNCERIPLEIGVGVGQYDKWAKLEGSKLIAENSTIDFLKTQIIGYYREWHKRTYSTSIKSTFVVLTEHVYTEMEPFDKELCNKIDYKDSVETGKAELISFWVADSNKLVQRGRILDFLSKIGKAESSWYRRIDRIFVPPSDYLNILQLLEKNKVVFLVGDPEIGKTYTAVRILWEYYCKGYQPVWHPGAELQERLESRKLISDAAVNNNSITYFEDPFGKIKFEDREDLRQTIGSFLSSIQKLDARVIVTSREEVFKKFEREKLSQSDLRSLSVEMRLMKPSYDRAQMETILINWATEFSCKWLQNVDLKALIVQMATARISTPLGIKDFALASKDVDELKIIDLLIKEKSKEVKEAFAEEIAKMEKEKMLFLSLAYILYIEPAEIASIYENICEKFGLDFETSPFSSLQNQFIFKIKASREDAKFEFTHSSYEAGLVSSWNRTEVKPFILKIMHELIENKQPVVRGSCGLILVKNFDEISFKNEAKLLITKILHDKNAITRYGVAQSIEYYFDEIPFDLSSEILEIMINDKHREVRAVTVVTIGKNFRKFPVEKSLEFLSQGLEDRAAWVRLAAVGEIRRNMNALPEQIIMKAITCCKELCDYTGWFIRYFASIICRIFEEEIKKLKDRHDNEL